MNKPDLNGLKKRWAISLAVVAVAGAIAAFGFNLAVRLYPPDGQDDGGSDIAPLATDPLAVDPANPDVPKPLPYACPIAGDCKLPGDDRRAAQPPVAPSAGTGNDRILPPD
ncbi:hypothetical protein PY365_10345 [Roseiarcaceae bacterium H3SJ34-1]|uniref:hypothetical protein n=1 Tax=Terripilifer ovatus TaxID=3032367 RepID=UPI003AB931F3|nr:hypothetical protein [Roseiarcaceae bacterium H3SJ34-1]